MSKDEVLHGYQSGDLSYEEALVHLIAMGLTEKEADDYLFDVNDIA